MELNGRALTGADEEMPALLSEALVAEVAASSGCSVVSEADITSLLRFEAARASCAGDADSCLAEIGAAFGAERVVSGTVGKLGTEYLLALRLLDVSAGVVEARAERAVPGGAEGLRPAVQDLGRELFGKPAPRPDTAPPPPSPDEEPAEGGLSASVVGGTAVATAGVLLLGFGAVAAVLAETRLADAASKDKAEMRALGLAGAAAAAVGVVVVAAGGVFAVLGAAE